jgi:hypothetical protein
MSNILAQILQRQNLDFDFSEVDTYNDNNLKKWDIDPLVLSVSLKDIADRTGNILSLDSVDVRNNVNEEIVERSEIIRKYYSKKFFWKNLSNNRSLSPFRQRVCYLLETRSLETKDKDSGIYFKLPWFYDEDMIYDDFKKNLKTENLPKINYKVEPVAKRLEYITSTIGWQLKRKMHYLWFKDDEQYLHGIIIEYENPLFETFMDLIKSREFCTFITRVVENRIDNMHYYKLHKFKLLEEK